MCYYYNQLNHIVCQFPRGAAGGLDFIDTILEQTTTFLQLDTRLIIVLSSHAD